MREPSPVLIPSTTARAGLTGFLKTMATEVAPDGVTVNSVQPGAHATDRLAEIYDDEIEQLARDAYQRDYLVFGFSDWG